MLIASDGRKNHSLAVLPDALLQRWLPALDVTDLPLGLVLYESVERSAT